MNKTVCDICGNEIHFDGGYEIRGMNAPEKASNRHMCEACFIRYILKGSFKNDSVEAD